MLHPADKKANNPRLQCVVCGKWMRLHQGKLNAAGYTQNFFGGCKYSNGGDHLACKDGDNDVCETCCHIECKRLTN